MNIQAAILCWIKTIWWSLKRHGFIYDGISVSGCNYVEKETHDNVFVQILECEDCGKVHIGWSRTKLH